MAWWSKNNSEEISPPNITEFSPIPDSSEPVIGYSNTDLTKYLPDMQDELPSASSMRTISNRNRTFADAYIDQYVSHPRMNLCFKSMCSGIHLGGIIGTAFGTLSGSYVAVVYRSPLLLPASVVGSAVSFGMFLGCGMLIRC